MSSNRSREGAALSVLTAIIGGEPWTVSSLGNLQLRKNFRSLNRNFCRSNSVTEGLRAPAHPLFQTILQRSELLSKNHRLGRHLISALVRVAAYSSRWIRSPESWGPSSEDAWSDLLNHLFVRWKLPCFFESAWQERGTLRFLERDWYCAIATGANWRTLEKVPASVTKRAVHFAMQAPAELSIRQALCWGQMTAMGTSNCLITEVLRSCLVRNLSNDEIWEPLQKKVAGNENFEHLEFGMVADLFENLYRGNQFFRARDLVQLPLGELVKHCRKYWERLLKDAHNDGLKFRTQDLREPGLRRDLQHYTNAWWQPMEDIADREIIHRARNGRKTIWQIKQLVRHSQLVAEGLAMKHCVDGYRRSCQEKNSAIFSIGKVVSDSGIQRTERRVTVEVYPKTRWLIQAKRRWNEEPEKIEQEVILKWAQANRILLHSKGQT